MTTSQPQHFSAEQSPIGDEGCELRHVNEVRQSMLSVADGHWLVNRRFIHGAGAVAGLAYVVGLGWAFAVAPVGLFAFLLIAGVAGTAAVLGALFCLTQAKDAKLLEPLLSVSQDIEGQIEHLEDLRWEYQENARRLQALLDSQEDVIIRRNAVGEVTFVNRAFSEKFGLSADEVTGCRFEPVVLEVEERAQVDDAAVEKLDTKSGPRWIYWTHHSVPALRKGHLDVQSIGRDVTEQRRHEIELAKTRDQAQEASRAKSRFLASMSHEIRTPMNGILGMAGLLEQTRLTPEQQTYNRSIIKSARTLLALIDEILDFSKIEAGRLELKREPVDAAECIQGVVELLAQRAFEKKLEIAWMVERDLPANFLGDEARLRQILINLVGNAIKFTERGGISISLSGAQGANGYYDLCFEVTDTGLGIDQDALDLVFCEFERVQPDAAPKESGTGLGLAIAKRLAHNMGGDITAKSAPGRGSTFSLSVHLEAIATDTASSTTAVDDVSVLLISSHIVERRLLSKLLHSYGAHVATAECSSIVDQEFLAALDRKIDVVVFDTHDDLEDAKEAFRQLREHNGERDIRSIAVSETGNRAELDRYRQAGIDQFLVRPVRPQSILSLVAGETMDAIPVTRSLIVNAAEPPSERRRLNVLVAEDNEINALLAERVLDRLQCTVEIAANGQEALDQIEAMAGGERDPFDVILMDLHMPVMDGFEATREIRRTCTRMGVVSPPIIAVTANAFTEDRQQCMQAGMDGYLSKPFEPADLERMLDKVVNGGAENQRSA